MEISDDFAQLRSQLTSFLFSNADGLTVSRLGISITLFFKQGYTLEKKQRILACYRRFREEFWYAHYDRGPLQVTPLRGGEPALVSGIWQTDSLPGKQYFFAQGTMAFDVEGAETGTTVWHLIRETENIAE
ncbi:hypothetical protein [Photorhabdus akhurstii]|uniref:hypothetical protein n=1 Tax=Photorhabdus akhurstii TaxID=171438 RepID=UPI0037047747